MPISCLIVDLMPRSQSPLEGRLIQSTLRNIGWETRLIEKVPKPEALRALFQGHKFDIIHITAHGLSDRINTPYGALTVGEIEQYFADRLEEDEEWLDSTKLFVNAICNGGAVKWQKFAMDALRVQNYLAPLGKPTFKEGILFPLALYMEFWGVWSRLTRRDVQHAWARAYRKLKTDVVWQLFPVPGALNA